MAKLDRLKEEIGWLKIVFAVLAAIDVSLVGWIAQQYTAARPALVLAAIVAACVVTVGLVRVSRLVYRRIEQLEDA